MISRQCYRRGSGLFLGVGELRLLVSERSPKAKSRNQCGRSRIRSGIRLAVRFAALHRCVTRLVFGQHPSECRLPITSSSNQVLFSIGKLILVEGKLGLHKFKRLLESGGRLLAGLWGDLFQSIDFSLISSYLGLILIDTLVQLTRFLSWRSLLSRRIAQRA